MTASLAEELARFAGEHAVVLLFALLGLIALASLLLILLLRLMEWEGRLSVARLTPRGYLSVHLFLGLAAGVGVMVFLFLAEQTAGETLVARADLTLARTLYGSTSAAGRQICAIITFFGSFTPHAGIGLLVGFFLAARRRNTLLLGWTVSLVGTELLISALKALFHRQRPDIGSAVYEAGWSFPSGHALGTLVVSGMLAYLLILFVSSAPVRIAVCGSAAAWTVVMGFSRMYLGVHYLSDVVAGFAAGTVWLAACISGLELSRRRGYASSR